MFVVSKVLEFVASPGNFLVGLGLLGVALLAWPRAAARRAALALLVAVPLGFAAIGGLSLEDVIGRPLENRFPQVADPPAQVAGIVVLGGGVWPVLSAQRGIPSLNDSAERMTSFVALARRYPQARLAFTGGSGALLPGRLTEADVAKSLFDSLGLAERGVVYESRSRTTEENAVFLRDLVRPGPDETWILVTSAMHMPRSVGVFRRAGWRVLAWPVGFKTPPFWGEEDTLFFPERLRVFGFALHEWIGLLAYRVMGRTDAVFPAP